MGVLRTIPAWQADGGWVLSAPDVVSVSASPSSCAMYSCSSIPLMQNEFDAEEAVWPIGILLCQKGDFTG